MKNKGTTFAQKYLYMANPKWFTHLVVPLLRQSKTRQYVKDKTKVMIGNQCPFMEGLENVINKLWILPFICHREQLSTSTQRYWFLSTERQYFRQYMWNIAQLNSSIILKLGWKGSPFSFLVSPVCMQINTQHWDLSSRLLRSTCRNVCLCVHVSVCVYIALRLIV